MLSNTIRYIFDTANPFEAAMVDTCITQTVKQPMVDEHIVDFYDGTADLSHPIVFTPIQQSMFRKCAELRNIQTYATEFAHL